MALYNHYNEAKKAQELPMAEKVGACLTCSYWAAETPRPQEEIEMVGLCVQPQLKGFALIVSGSSACNHWAKQSGAGEQAERYAKLGEAQA
ncbi:MAG: hypothetical protein H7Y38_09460 [Armatimonadetes bacterium]|nr:hypothetical protein [Armatimonadota bacterium]